MGIWGYEENNAKMMARESRVPESPGKRETGLGFPPAAAAAWIVSSLAS